MVNSSQDIPLSVSASLQSCPSLGERRNNTKLRPTKVIDIIPFLFSRSAACPKLKCRPPLPKSQPLFGRRHSTIIKLLGVGALVLVLLIPLAMITRRFE